MNGAVRTQQNEANRKISVFFFSLTAAKISRKNKKNTFRLKIFLLLFSRCEYFECACVHICVLAKHQFFVIISRFSNISLKLLSNSSLCCGSSGLLLRSSVFLERAPVQLASLVDLNISFIFFCFSLSAAFTKICI